MEDKSIISYFGRIANIIIGIKTCGGEKFEDEIVWKILKTLTPTYRQIAQMIKQVILLTKDFTRETLLGKLQSIEMSMRYSGVLSRVEISFSALSFQPMLTRSAIKSGEYTSSSWTKEEEDKKIKEGIALLMRREPEGNRSLNVGLVMNVVIMLLSFLRV